MLETLPAVRSCLKPSNLIGAAEALALRCRGGLQNRRMQPMAHADAEDLAQIRFLLTDMDETLT